MCYADERYMYLSLASDLDLLNYEYFDFLSEYCKNTLTKYAYTSYMRIHIDICTFATKLCIWEISLFTNDEGVTATRHISVLPGLSGKLHSP